MSKRLLFDAAGRASLIESPARGKAAAQPWRESGALVLGDCGQELKSIPDESVDIVVTDPPYFIDGMGCEWSDGRLRKRAASSGVVGSLPIGMKFDRRQGARLQEFMAPIAAELRRVLKPGGFCIVFSQARLYHRMAMCFDLAGFELRDMLAWKYEGQAKAFSQAHFIRRDKSLSEAEKERLIAEMEGYKTPQLKPQMEPMVMAQKQKRGTFVENWRDFGVGLINASESLDGRFPGNVMEVPKRAQARKGALKIPHLTVKPLALIEHLIRLFSRPGQTVLDPFLGSGTHAVAALRTGRRFIGIEREPKYLEIAMQRLARGE